MPKKKRLTTFENARAIIEAYMEQNDDRGFHIWRKPDELTFPEAPIVVEFDEPVKVAVKKKKKKKKKKNVVKPKAAQSRIDSID